MAQRNSAPTAGGNVEEMVTHLFTPPPRDEFVQVCAMCGEPLTNSQIALKITDSKAINYVQAGHQFSVTEYRCRACAIKSGIFVNGTIGDAVERLKEKNLLKGTDGC